MKASHEGGVVEVRTAYEQALHRYRSMLELPKEPNQNLLRHIIEKSGEFFPRVTCRSVPVFGDGNRRKALQWSLEQITVFFGFEPFGDSSFWMEMVELTRRNVNAFFKSPPGDARPAKLVLFVGDGERPPFDNWLGGDQPGYALECYLELIELNRNALDSLHATDDLLRRAEARELGVHPDEILNELTSEFDPIWMQITRAKEAWGEVV